MAWLKASLTATAPWCGAVMDILFTGGKNGRDKARHQARDALRIPRSASPA